MTGKQRYEAILSDGRADRTGFWLGNPHQDAVPIYMNYFNVPGKYELGRKLGNDFHWSLPHWNHPDGRPFFDVLGGKPRVSLGQAGVFAGCEDVREVEAYRDWPSPKYWDLDGYEREIDRAAEDGIAAVGGSWCCFFHDLCDFFGMENYFIKMHTDPDVVEALTERVVDCYLQANARIFERMGHKLSAMFLGNDFGSQNDLLISPECFRRFVLPSFKKLIDQGKRYGLKVMLHSCGAISRVIPDLIDAGVDALHPIQARARGMDAESLSRFKGELVFVGGIDTQQLLPFGTPGQVRDEVHRIRDILGPALVISPSHEALLKNVPPENVQAMAEAARD